MYKKAIIVLLAILIAYVTATTINDDEIESLLQLYRFAEEEDFRSINSKGLQLIKSFEGFRSCKYKDAAGYWTIGYGHLIKSGESFSCITEAEATRILKKDVGIAENCVSSAVKVKLNDNQFAALVSFTFNVGCGNLRSSTLLSLLNKGSYKDVCPQLARWNKAGGKVLPGLTRRRTAECNLFKS